MNKTTENLPGRVIGKRHTPSQNDAPAYYTEQAQHTPGPWYQMNDAQHECRIIYDSTQRRIAEADFSFNKEGLANARLIAAAPELLEALKHLLAITKNTSATQYTAAQATIAQAEGKAP